MKTRAQLNTDLKLQAVVALEELLESLETEEADTPGSAHLIIEEVRGALHVVEELKI